MPPYSSPSAWCHKGMQAGGRAGGRAGGLRTAAHWVGWGGTHLGATHLLDEAVVVALDVDDTNGLALHALQFQALTTVKCMNL